MDTFNHIFDFAARWLTLPILAYVLGILVVAIYSLSKRRDNFYREKYQEYLRQKERVEEQLKRDVKQTNP